MQVSTLEHHITHLTALRIWMLARQTHYAPAINQRRVPWLNSCRSDFQHVCVHWTSGYFTVLLCSFQAHCNKVDIKSYIAHCLSRLSWNHSASSATAVSGLTLDAYAARLSRRALRHIRGLLSDDAPKTIACNSVDARLDYYNSLLHEAPL